MKTLTLFFLLIGALSLEAADATSPFSSPHAITDELSDSEEEPSRDPFAYEETEKKATIADPLQPMNRVFFAFNDRLYFWVLKPVATGFKTVAPEPFRESLKRLFVNARYPIRAVNNLFQAKFKRAGIETARFLINSTVGIGGLFDPAEDEWRLHPYPEDLDQTLGFYRLPTGIYFNWPVFGPSSVRGTVGTIGDSFLSPWNYIDGLAVAYGTRFGDTVNSASLRLGEYEDFKKASFDPYLSLRDAYVDNRRSLVER